MRKRDAPTLFPKLYAKMTIYFIRHTSVNVPAGTCYGQSDVPLNDTFIEEATQVKRQIEGVHFDHVFTSPLTRCVELARFCGYPDAEREDLVKEFSFGEWEMKNYNTLYHEDPRFARWCDDYLHQHAPGGESMSDIIERTRLFIEKVKKQGHDCIAVFCHGGILASARILLGEVSAEKAMDSVPAYGSVMPVEV